MGLRADRLVELRRAKGLSQEQLARELNISQSLVSYYETGRKQPGYDVLAEMARLFSVSIDYLLGLSDDPRGTHLQTENAPKKEESSPSSGSEALKNDPSLLSYSQKIAEREDLKAMVREASNLKPETVCKIVELMKLIRDDEKK